MGRISGPSGSRLRPFAVLILDPCGDAASPLRPTRAGSADRAHRGERRTIGLGEHEIARASVGNVHDPMTIAPPNHLPGGWRTIFAEISAHDRFRSTDSPGTRRFELCPPTGSISGPVAARRRRHEQMPSGPTSPAHASGAEPAGCHANFTAEDGGEMALVGEAGLLCIASRISIL